MGQTLGTKSWTWVCLLLAMGVIPVPALAQGNIFGVVRNADLTNPAATDLCWVGFLGQSDQEIRIELNTGAGYDGANWFDDFQNYPTHAAGIPYDYFFVNTANGTMFHLSKTIPANSFQQEDILLGVGSFPSRPAGLVGRVASASRINLSWSGQTGVTYHVYRRVSSNNGSYRRLDDPLGRLTSAGVSDSFFVDNTSDGISGYTYVIIGQNPAGNFSAHSVPVSVSASAADVPLVMSVTPDSGAAVGGYIVAVHGANFDIAGATVKFGGNPATAVTVQNPQILSCTVPSGTPGFTAVVVTNTTSSLASTPLVNGFRFMTPLFIRGDINADGVIDVFDMTYLLDYIFSDGPPPLPVAEAGNVNASPDGMIDVFDLTYLIDYIFSGGPAPPP
jgi:hypothetical protein